MKKIFMLFSVLLLTGCVEVNTKVNGENSYYNTYCDEEYGVEYIETTGVYRGGLSVRLDENGNVIRCGESVKEGLK